MGGLLETKTKRIALIPETALHFTEQVKDCRPKADKSRTIGAIDFANAHVAATHMAIRANVDSVSFPF